MFLSWFASWWRKRTNPNNSRRVEPIRRPKFFRFLHLEQLEERIVPSAYQWTGKSLLSSNWNDPANWSLISGAGAFPNSPGDVAQFTGTPTQNLVTVNQPITVGEIDFGTAYNITIAASGANVLTLQNTVGSATITTGTVATNLGTDLIQAPINVSSGLTANLSGGAFSLSDTSSTTNVYAGTITFNVNSGGTLTEATANAALGLGSAAVNLSGGTLNLSNTAPLGTGPLTINSGTIQAAGAPILNNSVTFGTNASATLVGTSLTLAGGTVTLAGADTLTVSDTAIINDPISGPGASLTLTAPSSGSLTLAPTSNDTYSGGTTLAGGTLIIGNTNQDLGGANTQLTLTGGTLETSNAGGFTIPNPVAFSGSVTIGGPNAITFAGSNSVTLSGASTLTANIPTVINDAITGASASLTLGAGSISTLTLAPSTANTYGGGTTLAGGTLIIGAGTTPLGNTTTGTLTLSGGTLQTSVGAGFTVANPLAFASNAAVTIGGSNALTFSSGNAVTLSGTVTVTASDTAVAGTTFADAFSGSGGLTLAGTQTVNLTANNGYTGATSIVGGTLNLSGVNGALTGTSGISIYNTGTLQLNNGTNNNNARLLAAAPVNMNGGNLTLLGNSGANTTESFGALNLNSGGSTITSTPSGASTIALSFTQMNPTAGATLNVTGTNLGTATNKILFGTAPALTNNILPYVTVGGTAFATYGRPTGSPPRPPPLSCPMLPTPPQTRSLVPRLPP